MTSRPDDRCVSSGRLLTAAFPGPFPPCCLRIRHPRGHAAGARAMQGVRERTRSDPEFPPPPPNWSLQVIKAVFFDLDNTLTDFMRMKDMSVVEAI
jgi:hypothetical protein